MIDSPLVALFFLLGASLITGISSAMISLGKAQIETIAAAQKGLGKIVFRKSQRNFLTFTLPLAKTFFLLCYGITALFWVMSPGEVEKILYFGIAILLVYLIVDVLFRALSLLSPHRFFRLSCQIISFYLLVFYPISFIFYKLLKLIPSKTSADSSYRFRDKILEILHDSEFAPYFDLSDQKLILSVVSFKERIAREIMVPRINMITLSAKTSVKQAAESFVIEQYSRIPIWKDNVDNIVGTLYYKDLFAIFQKNPDRLDQSIETLIKPIVYSPETKKISHLLQEFRSKKIHLAIIVDEYGGTEGMVTIEDILEELVGEIADETDYSEEALYTPLPSGGWIIDARMTIIDIEEELGIVIEQSPEYDTIGGFIVHKAGAIPAKGWRLHQDTFEIEVLSSSERSIEKIRLIAH